MPSAVVLGDWHLASVTAAGLTRLGYRTLVWAGDPQVTLALIRGERSAGEPEVATLLAAGDCQPVVGERQLAGALASADLGFVAFDSATSSDGSVIDDRPAEAVRQIWRLTDGSCPVVLSSQVRAGLCDALLVELSGSRDDSWLVHLPENLRLGRALADFIHPERLVVGCNGTPPDAVREFTDQLDEQPIRLRLAEAELVKHGTNAFFALCITFANDVGWIARELGADAGRVLAAVRADPRIGDRAPLRPGDAYSGSTLQRDVRALCELGRPAGRDGLFDAVSRANAVHGMAAVAVLDRLLDGLQGRAVCLLGLTYKPNVSTLRDSPALRLAAQLRQHGCRVTAYDPVAEPLPPESGIERSPTLAGAVAGTDCVVLVTAHDGLRPAELAATEPGRLLFDLTGSGATTNLWSGWQVLDLWAI